jgi:hypothetical protein
MPRATTDAPRPLGGPAAELDRGEQRRSTTQNPQATALRRILGQALTHEGNPNLKLRKSKEATECYRAAEVAAISDPKTAAPAWFSLCATVYNTGDTDGARMACNRAIAAGPARANSYFL